MDGKSLFNFEHDDHSIYERHEPLRQELYEYLDRTPVDLFIRHPFCNDSIHDIDRCSAIHARIDRQTAKANACFEAGDYEGYLRCVDVTFQPDFLNKDAWLFGNAQYWNLLRTAYDNQKHTVCHRKTFETLFADGRPSREQLMTPEERNALARLPDVFTVYRGFGDEEYADGIAWTLHRPTALWYAHRDSGYPTVRVGRIRKVDVYAYCDGGDILLPPQAVLSCWRDDVSHVEKARASWDEFVPTFDLDAYLENGG